MFLQVRRAISLFALCVLTLPLLAACGGGAAPSAVNVGLRTFGLTASSQTARAGDVTFHIKNEATDITHEFVVLQTELTSDKLPVDGNGDVVEDQLTVVDEIEDIEVGKGGDLKVNLAAGHYVLLCNVEGHYKAGMRADLTVVP